MSQYDYNSVEVQGHDGAFTDMDAFQSQWTSTLFGGVASNVAMPHVPIDVLLEDALICIRIDDGVRLLQILESMRDDHGIPHPADVEFGEMFRGTLWGRVHDPDFKISDELREVTIELLTHFHTSDETQQ